MDGIERLLKLFCDNRAAVFYSNNNMSSSNSKHIDIKFLVVKEKVRSGSLSIEHIDTDSMLTDPPTKALAPKVFMEHTVRMGVVALTIFKFNGSSYICIAFAHYFCMSRHLCLVSILFSKYMTSFGRTSWK